MKITPRKFQQGGPMEAPAEDPAMAAPEEAAAPEQGGGDPLVQLAEMAAQALQAQDPNMMAQVCQALIELVQSAMGGGAPEGQPVYRKGGILVRRKK